VTYGSLDGTIQVWDSRSGEPFTFNPGQGKIFVALFSEDGRELFTSGQDSTIKVWSF
jgi:WD40 repeat protein